MAERKLTKAQEEILFKKATEMPFTSQLLINKDTGFYTCSNCGNKLFQSDAKFDSGTGWPSFDKAIPNSVILKKEKNSYFGMDVVEVVCAQCGGHLGHIFDDGPTKTGKRYCINGCVLDFKKK